MNNLFVSLLKGKLTDKISLLVYLNKNSFTSGYMEKILPDFNLVKGHRFQDFDRILDYIDNNSIRVVDITEDSYPKGLRDLYDPPFLIYLKGNISCLNLPLVGVVGTRKATLKGLYGVFQLGIDFGLNGIATVSGLASGTDLAVHNGVNSCKGRGIGVIGNGIDTVYPVSSRKTAAKLLKNSGLIISEYPPFEEVKPYNFPKRNRIIAGLSSHLVVGQAPEKSGSLITSDMALDLGREVLIHISGTEDSRFLGSDGLKNDGARVIERGYPVISSLGLKYTENNFDKTEYTDSQILDLKSKEKIINYKGELFWISK